MYSIPPIDYIMMSLMLFTALYTFQSYLTTSRIHLIKVISLTLLTALISTVFANFGEAIIVLAYFCWMIHIHHYTGSLCFLLLWELYDIVQHIIVAGILLMTSAFPSKVRVIIWLVPGLIAFVLLVVLFGYIRQHKQAPEFPTLLSKICLAHPIVLIYPLFTCLFLSLVNTVADQLASTKLEWFLFPVSATLIIANYIIFYYVLKFAEAMVTNEIYLSSQSAQTKYNEALAQQEVSTNQLLHDIQNILMAIEANLSQSDRIKSTIMDLVSQGRQRLSQSQPSQSLLTQIHTAALRNIIYLIWLQAAQQGVNCHIMASGNIQIKDANDLSNVLTNLNQIATVAIDNARKSSSNAIEIRLTQSPSSLRIMLIHHVDDQTPAISDHFLDSLVITDRVNYLETLQNHDIEQSLIITEAQDA